MSRPPIRNVVLALALTAAAAPIASQTPDAAFPIPLDALKELLTLQLSPAPRRQLEEIAAHARVEHLRLHAEQQTLAEIARASLGDRGAGLQQLVVQLEALTDRRIAALRTLRDDLLGVYEGLGSVQQARVQDWLLRQLERIERTRTAFASLREWYARQP